MANVASQFSPDSYNGTVQIPTSVPPTSNHFPMHPLSPLLFSPFASGPMPNPEPDIGQDPRSQRRPPPYSVYLPEESLPSPRPSRLQRTPRQMTNTRADLPPAVFNWWNSRSWLFWIFLCVAIVISLAVTVFVGLIIISSNTRPVDVEIMITIGVAVGFTVVIVTLVAISTWLRNRSLRW